MSGQPRDEAGRFAFAELLFGPTPAEDAAPADPRPQRPSGSVDQGTRGAYFVDQREAWRQWLAERLHR